GSLIAKFDAAGNKTIYQLVEAGHVEDDEDHPPLIVGPGETIDSLFDLAHDSRFAVYQVDFSTEDFGDTKSWEIADATILARSAAASLSVAAGSTGVAISGAGAVALNIIGTTISAYVADSTLGNVGDDIDIDAESSASIAAVVGAFSAAVGVGSTGVGVAIGAGVAINRIGFDLSGSPLGGGIKAYVVDSSIEAGGALTLDAHAAQSIDAVALAGAVAVAAGATGVAVSGSGVFVLNQIGAKVQAYISGNTASSTDTIKAASISIHASDDSVITTVAGAAAAAVAVGQTAIAVSIGAAVAMNEIHTAVDAYIADADVTAAVGTGPTAVAGDITVSAEENARISAIAAAASIAVGVGQTGIAISGAGAGATNVILTSTDAYIEDSTIVKADDVSVEATNASSIAATVAAVAAAVGGGQTGVGAAIGVSLARNLIGNRVNRSMTATTYKSGDTFDEDEHAFSVGDTVLVEGGINDGDVYQYIGPTDGPNDVKALRVKRGETVGNKDLRNTDLWRQMNLDDSQVANVTARVVDTTMQTDGTLSVHATSDQTIDALVLAGSVAVGAGQIGGGLAGAGVGVENRVTSSVEASIDGDGIGMTVGAVDLEALDTSTISADAGAAAIAAGFGQVGVAVSLGVAIAANVIDNTIEAFITGANSGLTAVSGDINVHAADESTIESKSVAASLSVAVGQIGVALAGAGAIAENVIGNEVNAYIEGGSIVEAAARFNYLSDDVLTGTVASPPRIVQNQRVLIVADLDDGPVDPRAG